MTIEFTPIAHFNDEHVNFLYSLLGERQEHQSISHKKMPTPQQHYDFVASYPYLEWHIINAISDDGKKLTPVGSIYLTTRREIGISILEKYQGQEYGKEALRMFMSMYNDPEQPFLANINPENCASIRLFEKQGFRHIQNTYKQEKDNC